MGIGNHPAGVLFRVCRIFPWPALWSSHQSRVAEMWRLVGLSWMGFYTSCRGAGKTSGGTSSLSSRVTAKMGTGGVSKTSRGRVHVQFLRQGALPHCTLTRVGDSSSLATALFCLTAAAAEQSKPTYFSAFTSGRNYKGGIKSKQ